MKKAIQFGAGNIGRGFIGALLSQSGYHVVFADVNQAVIDEINKVKGYQINVLGTDVSKEYIENISACSVMDAEIFNHIAEAEIITTAVGPNVLPKIAPTLAEGIRRRIAAGNKSYLNIIACENMVGGSESLREEVKKSLNSDEIEFLNSYVGFPNSAVDRIVPPASNSDRNILEVDVETFHEWIVDKTGFKGEIPNIKGMELTDKLIAFVERKLFTLNTGHAITAYLGFLKGYATIKESIEDKVIYKYVKGAMEESGEALIKKHGFDADAHNKYIEKILGRFKNPYLKDEVLRVGREPLRKLSSKDRLVNPLLTAVGYGIECNNLILGIAAAMHYENKDDAQAIELRRMIDELGVGKALEKATGIEENSELGVKIVNTYKNIKSLI
ncbi:Mannitol-1-phosphate 5-dehydrogenase [Caloramator mitchellensis]|uniref:Mannitol-1-phosphate 5-dehydrogenase n=1 Tax=Caloramator mitchellensis TaxID=908809 RepID=A0A0R3K2E4_CALMK|nr:mannitol-1-phosphate 5-dehydrogenase [Caloramator mitchellensis]KRQ86463.1 Mannitol-1-phosphate 5-dehydrogenase [Caloramator mitchellensis]